MPEDSLLVPLIRRLAASAIAALCALAITVGVMSYLTWQSMLWVRHTNQVQAAGTRALDLALNREASVSEYLIANDTAVLALERRAKPAIARALDSLALLTIDNPDQQGRLARVRAAVRSWDSSYVNRVLNARDSVERVRIGREERAGTATFAEVRASLESFLDEEAMLHARRSQRNSMWRAAEVLLVAFEVLVILAVLVYMRRELLEQAARTLEQQTQLEE